MKSVLDMVCAHRAMVRSPHPGIHLVWANDKMVENQGRHIPARKGQVISYSELAVGWGAAPGTKTFTVIGNPEELP